MYDHEDYEVQTQNQHQTQQRKQIPIVKFESEQGHGAYRFGYEAANGIQVAEQGQVKNEGQKDEAVVAEGFYAYRGDDGKDYSIQYVADENGFRAAGQHLPTPPPLPEENQRLIAEAYARPTSKYDEEDQEHEVYSQEGQQIRQQQHKYRAQQQYRQ